jgi:hypothetical protein
VGLCLFYGNPKLTIQGLVRKTEHIEFKTKNDKRRTRCYSLSIPQEDIDSDTGGITHVLKLTLRSGDEFVVDLACAQYGYSEPVMRWKEYKELRILFEHFGSGRPAPKPLGKLQLDDYSLEKMLFFLNIMRENKQAGRSQAMDFIEALNISMLEWQMDEKLSVRALLKLPERDFQRKKDDMVDYLDWKFDNPVKKYFTVSGRRLKKQWPHRWIHGK